MEKAKREGEFLPRTKEKYEAMRTATRNNII